MLYLILLISIINFLLIVILLLYTKEDWKRKLASNLELYSYNQVMEILKTVSYQAWIYLRDVDMHLQTQIPNNEFTISDLETYRKKFIEICLDYLRLHKGVYNYILKHSTNEDLMLFFAREFDKHIVKSS